ncbi:hypothetical protein N9X93_02385 [Alphaproteobacteria bacterium]|nr:hypothetical protein [Alphaproteobacteria bacterium]
MAQRSITFETELDHNNFGNSAPKLEVGPADDDGNYAPANSFDVVIYEKADDRFNFNSYPLTFFVSAGNNFSDIWNDLAGLTNSDLSIKLVVTFEPVTAMRMLESEAIRISVEDFQAKCRDGNVIEGKKMPLDGHATLHSLQIQKRQKTLAFNHRRFDTMGYELQKNNSDK